MGSDNSRSNLLPWLVVAFVAFVALLIFQSNVKWYPYYIADDMDQLTALDVLLIRGGDLPDHITHPTAGMYVLLSLTHRIGYFLGLLHMHDWRDVRTWANPLLGTAEYIDFMRAHLPYIAVAGSLLLALAVVWATSASPWMIAPIFVCIAASRGLAYHTLVFRTDSFALFYASAAAALAVAATRRRGWSMVALAVWSGIIGGFAFTAKIQIVPTVAFAPALVLLMIVRRDDAYSDSFDVSARFNRMVWSAAVAGYLSLLALSLLPMPSTFIHTRTSFQNFALCGAALVAISAPGIATRLLPAKTALYRFFSFANLMALGFVASFPLLWFVMMSPRSGIRLVAALAKVCFLGVINPGLIPSSHGFWDQVSSSPALFLPAVILLVVLSVGLTKAREFWALAVVALLIIVSMIWFDRGVMGGDAVFTEPMTLAFFCILFVMAWGRGGLAIRAFGCVLAIVVLGHGVAQAKMWSLTDTIFATYLRESRQIKTPFQTGNQQQIEDAFRRLLVKDDNAHSVPAHSLDLVYQQAADYKTVTRRVGFVVPNRGPIDWGRIGVLGDGLKPYGQAREEWFTSVPQELEGATVYVPPPVRAIRGADWVTRTLMYCGLYDIETDAWTRTRPEVIVPRSDMTVLVFVPAGRRDVFSLQSAPIIGIADRTYVGVPVPINPPEDLLRQLELEQDRFIVIARRYG